MLYFADAATGFGAGHHMYFNRWHFVEAQQFEVEETVLQHTAIGYRDLAFECLCECKGKGALHLVLQAIGINHDAAVNRRHHFYYFEFLWGKHFNFYSMRDIGRAEGEMVRGHTDIMIGG